MLQVQALIYLATPFIALPEVLLTREMDFKRPAIVNMLAAIVGALVALSCALSGFGVWTLIYAPIAAFWTRAIGLMIAARFFVWPSFRFGGASQMFNFGLVLLGSHFFWTIQTQADVFIAARSLTPTDLGFYAEALFLTTILSSKFIPPLNEVAFPAYARIQNDPARLGAAFAKAVQLIMLVACPAYFGLMVIADPLVHLLLGEKWAPIAPLITILAIAMPFLTLHVLIAPAVNAVGKPEITLRASLFGAVLMPAAFGFGVEWGVSGLAWAWVLAFPLIPAFAFWQGARHIGVSAAGLCVAIMPGALAAMAMAAIVYLVSLFIPTWPDWARLLVEISVGVGSYGAILWLLAPTMLRAIFALLVQRQNPVAPPESPPVPDQELAVTSIEPKPV
jgi:O-antigen/teichoic acid export membrane protein